MRKRTVYLYWEEACERYLEMIETWLRETFAEMCEIRAVRVACVYLGSRHYDPYRYQYDAVELLSDVPDVPVSLLLVHQDLYHPGYRFLYGAAVEQKAVVSDFRPDTEEGFRKEVCHEIGHALGLSHCRNDCVMRPSSSEKMLEQKSPGLCPDCKKRLSLL